VARTGRRPGESGTREAILDASRAAFARVGYASATIRGIARDAGVDPALVHHYFGTKEGLFRAAMQLPMDPAHVVEEVLAGPRDGLGERLVRLFLLVWDSDEANPTLLGLVGSALSHEAAAAMLRDFVGEELLGRVARALDVPDARLRASLLGSQMVGLAIVRYGIRLEPLASASPDQVVAAVAPTVQRYLTGPITHPPA